MKVNNNVNIKQLKSKIINGYKINKHVIFANFSHYGLIKLCEELIKIIPRGLTKFNFSDNGSSSIEEALKMAFQYHHQIWNTKK